jgi:hypothetical protein
MQSASYQRKAGDQFFTQRLVMFWCSHDMSNFRCENNLQVPCVWSWLRLLSRRQRRARNKRISLEHVGSPWDNKVRRRSLHASHYSERTSHSGPGACSGDVATPTVNLIRPRPLYYIITEERAFFLHSSVGTDDRQKLGRVACHQEPGFFWCEFTCDTILRQSLDRK